MEKPNKWDKIKAQKTIVRNKGKIKDEMIMYPNAGIKMQGCIDYLVNYCNFKRR